MEDNSPKLAIQVPEAIKSGVAANVIRITSTGNDETIFDFAFVHPEDINEHQIRQGTLVARVIVPTKIATQIKNILTQQLGEVKKGD